MNYLDEMRKKHFSKSLHLFNFQKCYDSIVIDRYYSQKIQSVRDIYDITDFCNRYDCYMILVAIKDDIGMIAIIRQRNPENYLFADTPYKKLLFKTPICVN